MVLYSIVLFMPVVKDYVVLVVLLQQYSTAVPIMRDYCQAALLRCRWWLLVGGLSQGGLACVSVDGALSTWSLLHPVHVSLSNFKKL